MRIPGKKILKPAFQLAGIILFIVILSRVDLWEVGSSFSRLGPAHAAGAIAILLLFTLTKAERWRTILGMQGKKITIGRAFSVYSASLYLGFLTPGRVGDFIKSIFLMSAGMPAGKAFYSSLLDRLFDLLFLVVIGYVSFLSFPGIFRNQLLMSSLILAVVISIAMALFWRRDILRKIASRFVSGAAPGSVRDNIERVINDLIGEFDTLSRRGIVKIILLTMAAWILHYGVFVLLADGLGTGASVHILVVSVSAAIFTALIPVSLSGLGTRDIVLILIFSRVGLTREAAVTFSLSFILVYLVQGVVGLICWLVAPFEAGRGGGRK